MFKNRKSAILVLLVLALALFLALGCGKKKEIPMENIPAPMGTSGEVPMPTVPTKVDVPPEIAKAWKAVVLEVADKDTKDTKTYTIKIGETAPLGNTGLTVFVEAFLPSFTMAGDVFTSPSNDLNNPAARVKITDKDGKQVFYSWLFALYPTTHPFDHPKYQVILKDYKKA